MEITESEFHKRLWMDQSVINEFREAGAALLAIDDFARLFESRKLICLIQHLKLDGCYRQKPRHWEKLRSWFNTSTVRALLGIKTQAEYCHNSAVKNNY